MAGDYLFPKRLFKDGEPLETNEVNEALMPPGERINGYLNQHNIRAPINPSVLAAEGTFYRSQTVTTDVDPLVVHRTQGPQANGAFDVAQDTSWQVIGEASEESSVELISGKSMLTMTAHVSHCYQNDDSSVREIYRFDMPSLGDLGITGPEYEAALQDNNASLKVSVFLNAPSVNTNSRSYLAVIPAPPVGGFASALALFLKDPVAAGGQLIAGDLSFTTTPGLVPPNTSYEVGNANGGGYVARRRGTSLFFTAINSGAATQIFSLQFFLVTDNSTGTGSTSNIAITGEKEQEDVSGIGNQTFSDLDSFVSGSRTLNYFAGQVQYAFRIDGAVLSESITGRFDNELRTVRPLIRRRPLSGNRPVSGTPNPTDTAVGVTYNRFPNRPDAVNIPMYSTRLTASVEVEPGAHLVELVVRRVPCGKRREFQLIPPPVTTNTPPTPLVDTDHRAMIYNRMLSVTEIPLESISTSPFKDVLEIPVFENEDVVDNQALYTERLKATADASNEIKPFQVSRGAINGDHLGDYSTVLAVALAHRDTSMSFFASVYPYKRRVGVLVLTNNLAKLPRADPGAALTAWVKVITAPLTRKLTAGTACTLTIEGNVFLERLQTDAPDKKMHTGGAFFCVALECNGNFFLYFPGMGWVNSNNYFIQRETGNNYISYLSEFDADRVIGAANTDDIGGRDYVDVPVTAVLQFEKEGNNALLEDITSVGIFAAGAYMANSTTSPGNSTTHPSDVSIKVSEASINAVVIKS